MSEIPTSPPWAPPPPSNAQPPSSNSPPRSSSDSAWSPMGFPGEFYYLVIRPEHRNVPHFPMGRDTEVEVVVGRDALNQRAEVTTGLGLTFDRPGRGIDDQAWLGVMARQTHAPPAAAPLAFHLARPWPWTDEPGVACLGYSWVDSFGNSGPANVAAAAVTIQVLHELAVRDYGKLVMFTGRQHPQCAIWRQLFVDSFPLFAPVPGAMPDAFVQLVEQGGLS